MEAAYMIPVHPAGKLIILTIVAYGAYVTVRLWALLARYEALNNNGVESQDSYIERAKRSISAIKDLEQADWKVVLSTLREQELTKLNFARAAPNTLLLLGLLGTVLGLAETVGSLVEPFSNALNDANPQEVLRLLSFTLQQMGTAFSCTIWGISAALLMGVVVRYGTSRLLRILSEYDVHILENIVPAFLPKSQAAQVHYLQELVNQSQEIVSESRKFLTQIAPIMREAAGQFEKVLQTTGQVMQQSVEKLNQTAREMQDKLHQVAQGVIQSASVLENSSRELRESTDALAEYHTDLRNAHRDLLTVFEQARSDLENQIQGQLEKIGMMDENFRRNAQDIVSRIDESSRHLEEATNAFREAGDRFTQEGSQIHSRIASYHQQLTEYVENLLKDHRWAIDEVEKSVSAISDSLRAIKDSPVWQSRNGEGAVGEWDKMESVLREIQQALDGLKGEFSRMLTKYDGKVAVVSTDREARAIEGSVRDTRPVTTTAPAIESPQIASIMEQLVAAIHSLRDSVERDMRTSLRDPAVEELSACVNTLAETIQNLGSAVQEFSRSLQAFQPRTSERKHWLSRILFWRRKEKYE